MKLIEVDDAQGARVKQLDSDSEVGIFAEYRQNLVDLARGARKGTARRLPRRRSASAGRPPRRTSGSR
ncbi:hypothetical protein [Streptomyces shaanxiensis]